MLELFSILFSLLVYIGSLFAQSGTKLTNYYISIINFTNELYLIDPPSPLLVTYLFGLAQSTSFYLAIIAFLSHSLHHCRISPVQPRYKYDVHSAHYLLLIITADSSMDPAQRPSPICSIAFSY
jgi:hypothetical protein